MKQVPRALEEKIFRSLKPNKVLVLLGARRIGKTVLLKEIMKKIREPYLLLNGEDLDTAGILQKRTVANYKNLLGDKKLLLIDEAQKIPDIGAALKLMVDEIEGIKIIVTGSSLFDLNNQVGEPLTGRKFTYPMFPLAQMELAHDENPIITRGRLEERLVFGSYPELIHIKDNAAKTEYLKELVNSYLLKDILAHEQVRNSAKLYNLLRLLAYQVGKEVSLHELGRQLDMSKNTVERYLDLLSKVFVIYRLQGFSRNLRKEISKTSKWYFFDNGIRNALISNLSPLALRNDAGELWENYILSERIKRQAYTGMLVNNFFWRTYQQQEIDWIEERGGKLFAYEVKWRAGKKIKAPSAWKQAYPKQKFTVITPDNYLKWIT